MSEPDITQTEEYALGDTIRPRARKNAAKRVIRASRRMEAFALRRQGESFEAIGHHLGVSPKTVSVWVAEAVKQLPAEEAEGIRTMELARLDAMLAPLMRNALVGDVQAVDRVLKIMERRAKYLDLDGANASGLAAVGSLLDRLVLGDGS